MEKKIVTIDEFVNILISWLGNFINPDHVEKYAEKLSLKKLRDFDDIEFLFFWFLVFHMWTIVNSCKVEIRDKKTSDEIIDKFHSITFLKVAKKRRFAENYGCWMAELKHIYESFDGIWEEIGNSALKGKLQADTALIKMLGSTLLGENTDVFKGFSVFVYFVNNLNSMRELIREYEIK